MKILLFGDSFGLGQLFDHLPNDAICGLVGASNRPAYHLQLAQWAAERRIPFLVQPLPSHEDYGDFRQSVIDLAPDLIWTHSYSLILREDILTIPRLGGINIHGALLPEYRGCNPMQWAIIRGEQETGVTLHEMAAGIDEGNIIAQETVPLHLQDTWQDLQRRIYDATNVLIDKNMAGILRGQWSARAQDLTKAHYHRRRRPEDGEFSWEWPAIDIYNLIRALVRPHPGAFYLSATGQKIVMDEYVSLATVIRLKCERNRGWLHQSHGLFQLSGPTIEQDTAISFQLTSANEGAELGHVVLDLQKIQSKEVWPSIELLCIEPPCLEPPGIEPTSETMPQHLDLYSVLLKSLESLCSYELKAKLCI